MERVLIYDLNRQPVYDPEESEFWATDIKAESMWPKGFSTASFTFKRQHPWADWPVKESYEVKIVDGSWVIYLGRIETIRRSLSGNQLSITCVGWYVLFEEGLIHKRWVDILGVNHLHWPDGLALDPMQVKWVQQKRDNTLQVFAGTRDIQRDQGDKYRELYRLPAGTVRRVELDYGGRTGEYLRIIFYNSTTGAWEVNLAIRNGGVTGSYARNFSGLTREFEIWIYVQESDLYDQNDYATVSKLRVEANYEAGHPVIIPTYSQKELIIDIILLLQQAGAPLSGDFSKIIGPDTILNPYDMERPARAGQVVEDILSYGDSSLRTWGITVFDDRDSSDGLPQVATSYWNIDDYDYQIKLSGRELSELEDERLSSELYNYIVVGYVDEQGTLRYVTPETNPELKDDASIASEYRRGYYLELQQSNAAQAVAMGRRFLEFHRRRIFSGSFRVIGTILTRDGFEVPANRVRAGQRVKIVNTGEIFFLRHVAYEVENQTASLSPELPKDNLTMFLARQERQKKYNQPPEGMF